MREVINIKVRVVFDNGPKVLVWKNKKYWITKMGLHHTYRQGRKLIHVFSVVADQLFFRLEFDSESLLWKLVEVSDGLPD